VRSDDYFNVRRIYSYDTSKYKIVERNKFAYATNHLEEGSIGLQTIVDSGLISPMYTVFDTDDSLIDRRFLITVLKTETYRQVFEMNTSSSVDRRGGLRWEEFAALPFALPSLEEQKQLASAIESLEADLVGSLTKVKALRTQKRGLMQKLLSGEWRLGENFQ
jgi:type I restriction enzyme S subunit